MKVAQKSRRTAWFRRYELVSVCGIRQWRRHSCLLSPRAFFACLVFGPGSIRVRRGVARMPVAVAAMAAGAAALFTTRTATFRRSRSGLAP